MSVVDIVVIGGGIGGVSTAAELSAHGSVLLLEAETALGYHATGRSAAMFLPFYGNAVVRALNDASADHHREADGGVLAQRGFLSLAPDADAELLSAAVTELGLTPLDLADAARLFPILNRETIRHAAYTDAAWDLDTDLLLQNYRRRLLDTGGRIATGARIDRIVRDGAGWHVAWTDGEARAPTLVNAAGAWADPVAALAGLAPLGLTPHRRSMAQLAAPAGHDVAHWPMVEQVGEAWYAKPDAGRWLVSPADEDAQDPSDAWADDMVLAEGLDRYESAVTVPVTRPLSTWAGLRTIAPDRTLVVGPDPRTEGFWWCAGQAGYGFQTAPAVARLLRDRIAGAAPDLPAEVVSALAPARLV